ncbi:hypothetical protein [Candidatus Mycalebacterium sp.]
MPESKQHIDLVKRIVHYINDKYSKNGLFLLSDLPEEHMDNRPPKIKKHTPDVFAQNPITGFTIIGEAKIEKDIDTFHTVEQLQEFTGYLSRRKDCSIFFFPFHRKGHFLLNVS